MNYTTDIRGDLIFDGFGHVLGAPDSHDEHILDLLSYNVWDIIPAVAPDLNPEQVALPKDEGVDPAPRGRILIGGGAEHGSHLYGGL